MRGQVSSTNLRKSYVNSIFMTIVFFFLLAAGKINAFAAVDYVCSVGSTKYTSVQDAIDSIPSGSSDMTTITLLKDVSESSVITVPNNKKITIDLKGNALFKNGEGALIVNSGILKITDTDTSNKIHYFQYNKNSNWTFVADSTKLSTSDKRDAIAYETYKSQDKMVSYIIITGGILSRVDGLSNSDSLIINGSEEAEYDSTKLTLDNITLCGNIGDLGAAVYSANADLTVSKSLLAGNSAHAGSTNSGGAVFFDNGELTISDSDFGYNYAKKNAGALLIHDSTSYITDSSFYYNSSMCKGGALCIEPTSGTSSVSIKNSTIDNNKTLDYLDGCGGGISLGNANVTLENCIISNNTSQGNGGGIYQSPYVSDAPGTITIIGGEINNNSAKDAGGIYLPVGTLKLGANPVISGNSCAYSSEVSSDIYIISSSNVPNIVFMTGENKFETDGINPASIGFNFDCDDIDVIASVFGGITSDELSCCCINNPEFDIQITEENGSASLAVQYDDDYLADKVKNKISTLVSSINTYLTVGIQLDSIMDDINDTYAAYDALTQSQKDLVTNYDSLNSASRSWIKAAGKDCWIVGKGAYSTLQGALDDASTVSSEPSRIEVLSDIDLTDEIVVKKNTYVILDLLGHVLKRTGTGSVIDNKGNLTIDDTCSDDVYHYFKYKKNAVWEYISSPTSSQINSAIDISLFDDSVSTNSIIRVPGGLITGADGSGSTRETAYGAIWTRKDNNETHTLSLTINGGTICGNASSSGGAIFAVYCDVVINGGVICGNTAVYNYSGCSGGAITIELGSLILNQGLIISNFCSNGGGAIRVISSSFKMYGGTIAYNSLDNDSGGAIKMNNIDHSPICEIVIAGGSICNNSTTSTRGNGGAIDAMGGDITITGGLISGNSAVNGKGGGINCGSGTLTVTGGEISDNTANTGGGISISHGDVYFGGTAVVSGNTAKDGGSTYTDSDTYIPSSSSATITILSGEDEEATGGSVVASIGIKFQDIDNVDISERIVLDDPEDIGYFDIIQVEVLINAIGDVSYSLDSMKRIKAAESAYDALTSDQKLLVSNYDVLTLAKTEYDRLKSLKTDSQIVDIINDALDSVPDFDYDDERSVLIYSSLVEMCDTLTSEQQELIDNYEWLLSEWDNYNDYCLNYPPAAEVDILLKALENVIITDENLHLLVEAENAFNELTPQQKKYVSYGEVILEGYLTYNVGKVIELIDKIGTVDLSDACHGRLEAAKSAYEELSEAGQGRITDSYFDKYLLFTTAYTEYIDAKNVYDKIEAITRVAYNEESRVAIAEAQAAYDSLTDDEKIIVSNYEKLERVTEYYNLLKSYHDGANSVIPLIDAIDSSSFSNFKSTVTLAKTEYDKLTQMAQAYVDNVAVLETAYADLVAIEDAVEKIDNLGTIVASDTCKNKIDEADAVYESISSDQIKDFVTNYSLLVKAKEDYQNLVAVQNVIARINQIREVTLSLSCKNYIEYAENGYDALSDELKLLVSNYQVLIDARAKYDALTAAKVVIDEIDKIGKVSLNSISKAKIKSAEEEYNKLSTDLERGFVTNYDVLVAARKKYDDLYAANEVDKKIEKIGTVRLNNAIRNKIVEAEDAYKELTSDQKKLVKYYSTLTNAREDYDNLDAAKTVSDLIKAIGTVELTDTCKGKIEAAEAVYNLLSIQTRKNLVTNYSTLAKAREDYNNLAAAQVVIDMIDALGPVEFTPAYSEQLEAIRAEYGRLGIVRQRLVSNYSSFTNADRSYVDYYTADNVDKKIDNIGEVTYTAECYERITTAREAYIVLTDFAKTLVKKYDVLNAALTLYGNFEAADVVIRLIDNIGEVEYTEDCYNAISLADYQYNYNLTDEQKNLVTNYQTLQAALTEYSALGAVDALINQIEQLEAVTHTDECLAAIENAEEAYAHLISDAYREKVTNHAKLVEARDDYDKLHTAILCVSELFKVPRIEYTSACKNAIEAAEAAIAAIDKEELLAQISGLYKVRSSRRDYNILEAAETVIAMINGIGTVELNADVLARIEAAETAFDNLENDSKRIVTNQQKLTQARATYTELSNIKAVEDLITAIGEVKYD